MAWSSRELHGSSQRLFKIAHGILCKTLMPACGTRFAASAGRRGTKPTERESTDGVLHAPEQGRKAIQWFPCKTGPAAGKDREEFSRMSPDTQTHTLPLALMAI